MRRQLEGMELIIHVQPNFMSQQHNYAKENCMGIIKPLNFMSRHCIKCHAPPEEYRNKMNDIPTKWNRFEGVTESEQFE